MQITLDNLFKDAKAISAGIRDLYERKCMMKQLNDDHNLNVSEWSPAIRDLTEDQDEKLKVRIIYVD
jgi:nicotinamide riboside kinase